MGSESSTCNAAAAAGTHHNPEPRETVPVLGRYHHPLLPQQRRDRLRPRDRNPHDMPPSRRLTINSSHERPGQGEAGGGKPLPHVAG